MKMYQNNSITYKDTPIYTINDLAALAESEEQDKTYYTSLIGNKIYVKNYSVKTTLDIMLRREFMLLQKNFITKKTPYIFEDMLKIQANLEALVFLETVKYATYYVNARQLLQCYLYSQYDFSDCITSYKSNIDEKNIIKPN